MPPFIPQKRRLSSPPASTPSPSVKRPTLFETADRPDASATLHQNRSFLDALDRDESSSGQVSSDDFEDALPHPIPNSPDATRDGDDEDQIWEDAIDPSLSRSLRAPSASENIELDLNQTPLDEFSILKSKKKGPSKIERQIRVSTHCMHVQFLLFHNAVRNGWACDAEVQSTLVSQLPASMKKEISRWRTASGLDPVPLEDAPVAPRQKMGRRGKSLAQEERNQRDWGKPARREEKGSPNMSGGDPVIRLLRLLASYWRKRFTIIAPGLRKQGYRSLSSLEQEITSFKSGKQHLEEYGERVNGIEGFRKIATICEGSRDVGAQLFTALIRGLGLEARLVSNLQCIGFGWNKNEEALKIRRNKANKVLRRDQNEISFSSDGASEAFRRPSRSGKPSSGSKSSRGARYDPVEILGDSSNASGQSAFEEDDESVVEITPALPRNKPNMNFDRDLMFPVYWTEVISPITKQVYPVESLLLRHAVATNAEHLAQFEPRGAKAEQAKQVFAYVVAHSPDGSAKDVTVRYLKRRLWPGRTKGVRIPVEKVPVYNKRGKIKRHEDYDWFRTVMSGYERTNGMRTAVDDTEETTDLKSIKVEKAAAKASEETLQGYKTSAVYVLERHLRREEALVPGAKPVKSFKQEPVFRREDVEICRTSESWHKEGRAVKPRQHPLKMVPIRAVTLTRKREVEEAERDGGEKLKQGLYARNQTNWIIPPPIENGLIPKNAYGNMDCFVPTMVPKGAKHIPLRSTVKICKKLRIDYAEAVTGFEFGNKRAVPVITGVIVAEENEEAVMNAWEKDEEERRIKEEGKREHVALAMFRKFLMGLRIVQRVREEYGETNDVVNEELNPFTNPSKAKISNDGDPGNADDGSVSIRNDHAGGFPTDGTTSEVGSGGFVPENGICRKLTIDNGVEAHQQEFRAPFRHIDGGRGCQVETGIVNDGESDSRSERFQLGYSRDDNGSTRKRKPKMSRQNKFPSTRANSAAKDKKGKASPRLDDPDKSKAGPTTGAAKQRSMALPRRKAARKSALAVKSHYFEHSSDDEQSDVSVSRSKRIQKRAGPQKVASGRRNESDQ